MGLTTIVTLWAALVPLGGAAFLATAAAWRRDRHGFIDRKALTAIPTLIIGALFAASILATPHLLPIADNASTLDLGKVPTTVTDAWVWVTSIVAIAWLYAAAAATVNTVMYYVQRRRLHAGDSDT